MLPVTHRKVTIVPHSLAAIAAGICLLAAFAWDSPVNDRIASGEVAATSRVAETGDGRPGSEDQGGEPARETSATRNNTADFRLLPLLMPRSSGGG